MTTTRGAGLRLARRLGTSVLGLATALALTTLMPANAMQDGHKVRSAEFDTASAMYAANEEWLTFACELPDGQVNIGSAKSVEMYYYSRYGLGNLLLRSGMGVHMVHNPLFAQHVAMDEGMPWHNQPDGAKRFLQHKMGQFVAATGADSAMGTFPPKGAYPIYRPRTSRMRRSPP